MSVRFHLADVGCHGGISPDLALRRAESSGEVLTSVFTVFSDRKIADLKPLIV